MFKKLYMETSTTSTTLSCFLPSEDFDTAFTYLQNNPTQMNGENLHRMIKYLVHCCHHVLTEGEMDRLFAYGIPVCPLRSSGYVDCEHTSTKKMDFVNSMYMVSLCLEGYLDTSRLMDVCAFQKNVKKEQLVRLIEVHDYHFKNTHPFFTTTGLANLYRHNRFLRVRRMFTKKCKPRQDSQNVDCPICFETRSDAIILPCTHRICFHCFERLETGTCPMCRAPLPHSEFTVQCRETNPIIQNRIRKDVGDLVMFSFLP